MLTVVLCHAGLPFAQGGYAGVDVFFVISGFVITRLLLGERESTGRISLSRFYARRAKRLLPLAATVVAVTLVLASTDAFSAGGGVDEVSGDAIAAGLYLANWHFAAEAGDYFASPELVSPLQHFWSLAVEEQFYLVWPLLLLGLVLLLGSRGGPTPRNRVALVVGAIAAASFAHALAVTGADPGPAYFSTFARVWELALGALLALVPLGARLPRPAAAALGWAGLAAIVFATAAFGDDSGFPGAAALVPTLGAAALIAAGAARSAGAPTRLLALRPMQAIGRHSYALYLWHWPVLVLAAARWGPLSPAEGLVVAALAAVPAVLSHRWIEEPFRRSQLHVRRPRHALALAPACAVLVVGLAILVPAIKPAVPTLAAEKVRGAKVMRPGAAVQTRATGLRPTPRNASKDRSRAYTDGCLAEERHKRSKRCAYGRRGSSRTVVLFGDSHAMQWFPAIESLSQRRGWRMLNLTKAGCPVPDALVHNKVLRRAYHECTAWRRHTLRRIERERPRLVVVSSATFYRVMDGSRQRSRAESGRLLHDGWVRTLRRLVATGANVVALEDTPAPPNLVPRCVARSMKKLGRCAFPRRQGLSFPHYATRAAAEVDGVKLVDAAPKFCLRRVCPAVIGDVLVYRNGGHVTATYARTMSTWLGRRLRARRAG